MINIVIVDSGVNLNHKIFKDKFISSIEFSDGMIVKCDTDDYGHGTAIAGIISRCDNVNITMIRIKDIEKGIQEDKLISVLNYINMMDNVDIVNLSLGLNVCEDFSSLYNICKELAEKGVIIVSAFDNTGSISYPAAFDNVIGVITGQSCHRINDFEFIDDDIVNIAAKGNIQRVAWTVPEYLMIAGNSFACAHVTVQIAKFIQEGIRCKEQIINKFKEISIKKYNAIQRKIKNKKLFTIRKASLFPFNKEMHSLVRFAHLLPFELVNIYDTKYSPTVGSTTCHLLKDNYIKDLIIKNIEQINWDEFDTLILGHTGELSAMSSKEIFIKSIIETAINKGKQIYSFDDIGNLGYENNECIFYPSVDSNDLPPNRFGMLYRILKPVVGIFGTSSKQGKFTLQLKLRSILLEQGYDIGQIGTEPSSLLFGMDYCFPMGYNSSVQIKEFDTVRYLNHIVNDLCMSNKDIIIVGSQSGTISYDIGNIVQYPIPQYNFLLGTQPDVVVLCVNPYDDINYIKRTISFIESSIDSKVISLVVFPMDFKDNWTGIYGYKKTLSEEKYYKLKEILYNEFNLPIFKLGLENDMSELVNLIINYFSED